MGTTLTPPSDFHNYEFISPDSLYAEIREEMRSYFDTGALDDTMFPIYTEKALKKLGRTAYKIDQAVLTLENSCSQLPADFSYIREVWVCKDVVYAIPDVAATYSQQTCIIGTDGIPPCDDCPPPQECDRSYKVFLKTTGQQLIHFKVSHLLRPGNRRAAAQCSAGSANLTCQHADTFDIADCKIHTGFSSGTLYLVYYKKETDENQFQLIPDNHAITEYVKAYIKYKLYELLYNQVTDETFNHIERKYNNYRQEYLDAHIIADAEVKKQTIYQKINSINRDRRRLSRFFIP